MRGGTGHVPDGLLVPFHRAFQAGLLQPKEAFSTDDLEGFTLSRAGKALLREDEDHQILFVPHSQQAALMTAIQAIRRPLRLASRSTRVHSWPHCPTPWSR